MPVDPVHIGAVDEVRQVVLEIETDLCEEVTLPLTVGAASCGRFMLSPKKYRPSAGEWNS